MPYFVTQHCTGLPCQECVAVCPENCFYNIPLATHVPGIGFMLAGSDGFELTDDPSQDRSDIGKLVIDPEECISCGACETECPVEAIYEESEALDEFRSSISMNAWVTGRMTPKQRAENRCFRREN